MSKYYVGKPKRHGTYTGAGGPTGPIPAPSNTGPAQVTEGQVMSDDGGKLAMSGLKNVQGLIVAGRRVWHSEHDYTATCKEVVDRSEYSETPWISIHGFMGLASPLSYFLPILTAAEVRGLPVGAVLVDTLTGEDCVVTVDDMLGGAHEFIMYGNGPRSGFYWDEAFDRDLENRFALKTLPTEDA